MMIFVLYAEELHLFAFPDDYCNRWFPIINYEQLYIIPCRPTSPDISVKLYTTGDLDVSYFLVHQKKEKYINVVFFSMFLTIHLKIIKYSLKY